MRHKKDEKQKTMNGVFFNKLKSINFFFLGCSSIVAAEVGSDLNVAPMTTPLRIMPAIIHRPPLQPNDSMRANEIGLNRKVPTPEPQEAIPVANALYLSKQ